MEKPGRVDIADFWLVQDFESPRPLIVELLLDVHLDLLWLEHLNADQEWGLFGGNEESAFHLSDLQDHEVSLGLIQYGQVTGRR